MPAIPGAVLTLLIVAASMLGGCPSNCATYVVTVFAEDQLTGNLLCDAVVRFGVGDAGQLVDGSIAPSDAEIPASSGECQWDIVVGGGTYEATVTVPGFAPGSATVQLSKDECGSATVPVTVMLSRP